MTRGPPKERLTVSLHPQNKEFLDQGHINASGWIDQLVRKYRNGQVEL